MEKIKILNLYACLGGNRYKWDEVAKEKGIKIVTISVGTVKGGQIPLKENGKILGYKKDSNGEIVVTKMNAESLKKIAEVTKGKYLDGNINLLGNGPLLLLVPDFHWLLSLL